MHYVTEDELREAYAREAFGSYELPEDARLTPGARQFLIDFRVSFEADASRAGSRVRPHEGPGATHREDGVGLDALVYDANLLGARLRLLARRTLGVNNTVAREAEGIGRKWQEACVAGDLADGEQEPGQCESPLGPAPVPALDAGIHPVFFEMACVHAQIGRYARSWAGAQEEMGPTEARVVRCWLADAACACALLEGAIARAEGEV